MERHNSNKSLASYNKMTTEQLQAEQAKLRENIDKSKTPFRRKAITLLKSLIGGVIAGTAFLLGTSAHKNPLIIENAQAVNRAKVTKTEFSVGGKTLVNDQGEVLLEGKNLALGVGAAAAVVTTGLDYHTRMKEEKVKAGIEHNARLTHVERLLNERNNEAVSQDQGKPR